MFFFDTDPFFSVRFSSHPPISVRFTTPINVSPGGQVDDAEEFHGLAAALSTLNVTDEDQEGLWRLLSALLHLGNIRFSDGHESVGHGPQLLRLESPLVEVEEVAKMAGLPADRLKSSLRKKVRLPGSVRGFLERRVLFCDHIEAVPVSSSFFW